MNPNLPSTDEFDPQERELARIVRALPGGEPPASLDAKILRAAGDAAAASRRPGARWLAAITPMWGIGGAAAAVLALGVSWQMIYGGPQSTGGTESAAAPAMSDQAEDASVAVEFKQERAVEADQPVAAMPAAPPPAETAAAPRRAIAGRANREPVASLSPAPAPPPPPPPEPQAFSEDALDEHVAARPESRADSGAAANLGAAASAPSPVVADSADRSAMAKSSAEASVAAPSAQSGGLLARERQQGPMKPANWLAEIRELRDARRTAEARQSLLEFRRRYPAYVIPSDLAPLLRE